MNLILDTKPKMSLKRKIIYISVLIICIVAILIGTYLQVFNTNSASYTKLSEEEYIVLETNFENIFLNNINNNSDYKLDLKNRINSNDNIIGVSYLNASTEDRKYSLNVTIPYININSDVTKKYNSDIEEIFKQKALDILEDENASNVIYTVEYTSYINDDILSLIIRSTLKEGNNAQRVIVQTYNYNLSTDQEVTIDTLLDLKGITRNYAESEVVKKIREKENEVESLKELGYSIFERDYTSDIYKMRNTTEYFLGEQGRLYLVYAYGNDNYTSEIDVVIL